MTKLFEILLYPPYIVAGLTMIPFYFFFVDSQYSYGVAKMVGADIELYFYAITCIFSFTLAFFCSSRRIGFLPQKTKSNKYSLSMPLGKISGLRKRVALISLFICTIGLAVIITTAISTEPVDFWFSLINASETKPDLRYSIIASENIPGIFRMFGYLIPGSVVFLISVMLAYPEIVTNWKSFWIILLMVVVVLAIRGLVFMDRNSIIFAVILCTLSILKNQYYQQKNKLSIFLYLLMIGFVLVSISYVQAFIRGNELLEKNTFFFYADQGMANASLALRTTSGYSFGFTSLLGFLSVVPRGIGLEEILIFPSSNREYVINDAANLLTYSFVDFYYFGFLTYIVWGIISGWLYRARLRHPKSVTWWLSYNWHIFALLTIWIPPISGGPDFWCGVIFTLIAASLIDNYYKSPSIRAQHII